ncbi:ABC transporter ATP-binding protein [Dyadobacter psychrotolerans]|uniref:ABC transporter ATP-binding protein n=2 Tax=Dyadobacter psychrotolerans TaxID=2541721 RepID=A0A4V2Z315_9BACT|nr:ABC transporter ATP-binding protein [Dyadobacter psychrotolerans]
MYNSPPMIIETQDLNFGFDRHRQLIKNLNIMVPRGSIYGFLGPNGAGKTTTIRLLLGLLSAVPNKIYLFRQPLEENKMSIFSRIGALIEQPSLYEHLSGRDNLIVTQRLRNIRANRVEEVLKIVDLHKDARKRVSAYSMGMKQRLGIAIALLAEPDLLILDEPINGLDPNGIIEIRELLIKLNQENGTSIFLSSHQLPEIEKLVTHLGIIDNGQLIFQGTIQDLGFAQGRHSHLKIETNDNTKAQILIEETFGLRLSNDGNYLEVTYGDKEQIASLCNLLVSAGISIFHIEKAKSDLESLFLNILKKA